MRRAAVKFPLSEAALQEPKSLHWFRGVARLVAKMLALPLEDVGSPAQVRGGVWGCRYTIHPIPIHDVQPANPPFFSSQINSVKSCRGATCLYLMANASLPFCALVLFSILEEHSLQ